MYGVQIAFKYYSPRLGIWGSTWTGMENLNRFFDSYYFWRLLRNTVGLSLYNLIVAFPFPILLALVFNEVKSPKLKKAVQTISYAPHFISVVVLVGILNLFFNQGNGLINVFLDKMGFEKFGFLTSSAAFPSMYVWSGVWQNAGWNSIIILRRWPPSTRSCMRRHRSTARPASSVFCTSTCRVSCLRPSSCSSWMWAR